MKLFKRPEQTIAISSDTIIRTIVYTIVAVMALQFMFSITHQLRLIGIAAFLAIALNPAVSFITRHLHLKSRVKAAGIAYLLVISILFGFLAVIVPPLVKESTHFIQNVPKTVSDFQTQDTAIARFVRNNDLDGKLNEAARDFADRFGGAEALDTASRIGGTIVSLITVLVLTFMMLVEGPGLVEKTLLYVEAGERKRKRELVKRMYKVVTGYVNGQVLIAGIAALFAMVVLLIASSVINVSVNVVALSGIVFIFGLIPLIGNILAASLVVLFCLFASTTLALIMGVFFIVYQQVENATLQPYIQAKNNELTPLTVFIAAIVGAGFGGLLGALAAIPLAGCLRILFLDRYPPSAQKEAEV